MLVKACSTAERISSHCTCHKMYPTIMQSIWHVAMHTNTLWYYEVWTGKRGVSSTRTWWNTPLWTLPWKNDRTRPWQRAFMNIQVSSESSFYNLPLDSCPVQSSSLTTYEVTNLSILSTAPYPSLSSGAWKGVCQVLQNETKRATYLYNQKRSAGSLLGSFNHSTARCVQPWSPPLACTHP